MLGSRALLAWMALAGSAAASPLHARQDSNSSSPSSASAAPPTVTIYPETSNGDPIVVSGSSANGVDSYWGIPFAAPPVGDLRFAKPQSPTWNSSTFNATSKPPACLQAPQEMYTAGGMSEDCLYLNVQVPAGTNGQTAWYPVIVWVYGGSFVSGSSAVYDGSVILAQAVLSDKPVVYVSINYRLGIFGFANGKEAADAGAANLGLRDLQKSLEWVKENIWAFGGDPDQVTVFGESAGAVLISELFLQPDIDLFKGAIMESGAQSTAPIGKTESTWQAPYDLLAKEAGCNSTAANATANGSSLECLKKLPAQQLIDAQQKVQKMPQYSIAFPFAPSIDGDLIPDSPHTLLAQGKFARIPFISGNNKDEGTSFVPIQGFNLSNPALLALALELFEPTGLPANVTQNVLGQVYPNVPAVGAPFGTGNETFGLPPEFKQIAAILTDAAFQAPRRWFQTQAVANGFDKVWSYFWDIAPPSTAKYLGTPHGVDVYYVFGLPQLAVAGLNLNGQGSLASANFTQDDATFSKGIIDRWLNFAWYTDPNGPNGQAPANGTYWPAYGSAGNMYSTTRTNISIIQDTYRKEQMDYLVNNSATFNYKRGLGP